MALALPSKDAIRWRGDKVISRASMIMILSLFSVEPQTKLQNRTTV